MIDSGGYLHTDDGWIIAPDGARLRAICGGTGSGGGKTTVTNQIPAKTPEEIELIRKQNDILDIQTSELRRQNEALSAIFPEQQKLLAAQTAAAIAGAEFTKLQTQAFTELLPGQVEFQKQQMESAKKSTELQDQLVTKAIAELEGTPEEREIRTLSNQRALAILKGEAPPLLPGQQERINTIFGAARDEATTELTRFGEDLATTRGMRVTDSPIGNELLRQKRTLEQNLAAGKAGAELDVGQAQNVFTESVRQFQENLRQRGIENRMALTGRTSPFASLPLGSAGGSGSMSPIFSGTTTNAALAGAGNLLNTLSADRLGQATQSSRTLADPSAPGRAAIAGGVGGAASGAMIGGLATSWTGPGAFIGAGVGAVVGGLGGYYGSSSATLKRDIAPLDVDEYEKARRTVRELPIVRYRYKHEDDSRPAPHIGPLAETLPDEVREGKLRVNLLDLTGLTLAAVKGVDRRIDRLEASLPVKAERKKPAGLPVRKVA